MFMWGLGSFDESAGFETALLDDGMAEVLRPEHKGHNELKWILSK